MLLTLIAIFLLLRLDKHLIHNATFSETTQEECNMLRKCFRVIN
jgi:hypothetical protein